MRCVIHKPSSRVRRKRIHKQQESKIAVNRAATDFEYLPLGRQLELQRSMPQAVPCRHSSAGPCNYTQLRRRDLHHIGKQVDQKQEIAHKASQRLMGKVRR